jgi:hypothetical protein
MRAGAIAVVMITWVATRLAAQTCVFQIDNVERQGSVIETRQGTNYFAGGNVRLSCRGSQITMQSDSVASYGGNTVQFIGNVKYRDSTVTMDADKGIYHKRGEKWEARGRVTTRNLKSGSTLTGPALDYFRVVKGVRDTVEMYATGRRSRMSSWGTESGSREVIGSGLEARSPSTAAISAPVPIRCGSTPVRAAMER